jgi:hypothetical protein
MSAPEPTPPPELPEDVRALAAQGHTIQAVKRLRERTGLGLKEARELVDTVPPPEPPRRGGCGGAALLLAALLGALLAR